jgi:hypothetical protein
MGRGDPIALGLSTDTPLVLSDKGELADILAQTIIRRQSPDMAVQKCSRESFYLVFLA